MDTNSPEWYCESSAEQSIKDTENFSEYVLNKNNELVIPIITPRFAPSCTSDLLHGLSKLAIRLDLPIQTHLAENKEEIKWAKQLFPDCSTYTDIYFKHGLLNDKTILAHCVYLDDDELSMIKKCRSGISHCPNSNISLQSGLMCVRDLLNRNINVSLGTDVAGGYSSSILDAIRNCISVSKIYSFAVKKEFAALTVAEAFYLATMGGAKVLNLTDKIGNFEVGKDFDALIVDFSTGNTFDYFDNHLSEISLEEIFEKFIYLGDDRNILDVFVKGKLVYTCK
jgi:guanine deaminase